VSQAQRSAYEFDETLPVEPVAPGTNLLVTGPTLDGLRELVTRLLVCRNSEGLLLLSTDTDGPGVISAYEAAGCSYEPDRMAVVDCTEESVVDEARNVYCVSDPGDLTGMGIVFSSLYEQLYDAGIERVRTGVFSLSTLVMYVDDIQPLYRFLHTLTGRIRRADGLGVCAVDPETQEEMTLSALSQPFDAEVQLRKRDGSHQLRVRGLPDQPAGWQPVVLPQ